jgi:hypothetical protein
LGESGGGLIEVSSQYFLDGLRKTTETAFRIVVVLAEV